MRLGMEPHLDVCGEAESEDEAVQKVLELDPHLVIIDITLKNGHGIELIKRIRSKRRPTKMLVVSGHDETLYAGRAVRAGAHGYLNKQHSNDKILEAVTAVLNGESYFSESTEKLAADSVDGTGSPSGVGCLSDRELQIFELIGNGETSRVIASRLHLSPHTIDTHRENIKRKIGARTSAALTRAAVQWRLGVEE